MEQIEEKLLSAVRRLCSIFQPLQPTIKYSRILTQEDVLVYNLVLNRLKGIIEKYPSNIASQKAAARVFLRGSTGMPVISQEDVQTLEILISASESKQAVMNEWAGTIAFLRESPELLQKLKELHQKIIQHCLVNTVPIVMPRKGFLATLLGFEFQEFEKLLHESIHAVLKQNGIFYNDERLDEGLCTWLHICLEGPKVEKRHYTGPEGERYKSWASIYARMFEGRPKSSVIGLLKQIKKEELKAYFDGVERMRAAHVPGW